MQECLRSVSGADLKKARAYIRSVLDSILPLTPNPAASGKKNLLLKLAQVNFEGTCRLLNFLIDIHLLT